MHKNPYKSSRKLSMITQCCWPWCLTRQPLLLNVVAITPLPGSSISSQMIALAFYNQPLSARHGTRMIQNWRCLIWRRLSMKSFDEKSMSITHDKTIWFIQLFYLFRPLTWCWSGALSQEMMDSHKSLRVQPPAMAHPSATVSSDAGEAGRSDCNQLCWRVQPGLLPEFG